MKKIFLLAFLFLSALAFGQGTRWDLGSPGGSGVVTTSGAGLPYLIALPGVQLNWCNFPANAAPCTNFAPTFTSITLATPCPTNAQVVLQGSSTCQTTGDNSGNLGVWTGSGTYSYTLTYNAVVFGPFVVTIGGGGGGSTIPGGLNTDVQYNCLSAFCGSANFTFNSGSNLLTVTGSLAISGNASLGSATIAGSASAANLTLSGLVGSDGCLTSVSGLITSTGIPCGSGGGGGITGSGTINTVPLWTGTTALGNSVMTQVSGQGIAIGTSGTPITTFLPFQVNQAASSSCVVAGAGGIPISPSGPYCGAEQIVATSTTQGTSNTFSTGLSITNTSSVGNAVGANISVNGFGDNPELRGFEADVIAGNPGATTIRGLVAYTQNAGGSTTTEQGLYVLSRASNSAGTVTNNYGVYVDSPIVSGTATLTHNYGIFINAQTGGTNNLDPWGIFQSGTAKNQFGGNTTFLGNVTISGTCAGCQVYPAGTGIPQVVGGAAWGSTLSTTGSGNVVLSNSPTLVTPALGTPSAIVLTNATGAPTWNQNTTGTAANLTGCTPSTAGSVCIWNGSAWTLFAGNTSGTASLQENASGVPSWGSGSATTFQANGTPLISATTVNFQNSAATNGITLTFTNGSAGNVTLGYTGTLTNAGLATPTTTVNGQSCTLGATCTIPEQVNSVNLTSQAGFNLLTSTANAVGLTVTPVNSATNALKFEITGGTYTGTAAGLNGTPSITVNALTATTINGATLAGTFAGSPTFSGNPSFTGSPVFNMTGGPFCVHEISGVLSATASDCGSGGGGSVGPGTQNYIAYFNTPTTIASFGSGVSGAVPTLQAGGPPIATTPSMSDSTTSPVVTSPYGVQCDSATTIIDRAHIVKFQSGASVINIPLSSGSGCGGLVTSLRNRSGGDLTVNKTGADTFDIFNGSASATGQTTFTLHDGQNVVVAQAFTGGWEMVIGEGGTITNVIAGSGLSGGGTLGAVTLSIPAGGVTNAMLAGSISLGNLATQSQNTVLGAFTSTTVAANAMATCSANHNGEQYTTNTGFTCATDFGQLDVAGIWTANQTLTGHLIVTAHDLAVPPACSASGTGTAQTCTTAPTFTPAAGDCVLLTTATPNSGAGFTLNVNSTSAFSVAKWTTTTTLAAGDIGTNAQQRVCLDSANHWELDFPGNSPVGAGTVTNGANLTNTALVTGTGTVGIQTPSATSTLSSGGNMSLAGTITATLGTLSGAGAASTPGLNITGAAYTAGTATTNFPQLYINNTGSAVTTFSANGTQFGIAPITGFVGNDIDLHSPNGGASNWTVNYQGVQAITPQVIVGGSANYLSVLGKVAESSTGALVNFDSQAGGGGAEPNTFRVGSDGFAQMQVCTFGTGGAAFGANVFGSAIACSAMSTSPARKNVFTTATNAHVLVTLADLAAAQTGNSLEFSSATAAGTGFNFLAAYAGVTGTDGSHSGGTLQFSIAGNGSYTMAGCGANTFVKADGTGCAVGAGGSVITVNGGSALGSPTNFQGGNGTLASNPSGNNFEADWNPVTQTMFAQRWDTCGNAGGGTTAYGVIWHNTLTGTATDAATSTPAWPNFCEHTWTSTVTNPSGVLITGGDTPTLGTWLIPRLDQNAGWEAQFRFSLGATTTQRMFLGFGHAPSAAAPGTSWIGLRYDTSLGDTAFTFVVNDGTNSTLAFSSVSTGYHTLRMRSTVAGQINMSIDGGSEYCFTTSGSSPGCAGGNVTSAHIPTVVLDPFIEWENLSATSGVNFNTTGAYFQATGLSR